jgi:hypothetical protein
MGVTAEELPKGVYYSADTDNFYDMQTHRGMGQTFWSRWRHRKHDFSTETLARTSKQC